MKLSNSERRRAAIEGGRTRHSVHSDIRPFGRRADELTADDLAVLRPVVGRLCASEVDRKGLRDGAPLAGKKVSFAVPLKAVGS